MKAPSAKNTGETQSSPAALSVTEKWSMSHFSQMVDSQWSNEAIMFAYTRM